MKVLVCVTVMSLIVFAQAMKQLSCKATPGSVLYFLAKSREHAISCSSSSGEFEVTKEQYDDVIDRLKKAEMELSSTKSALAQLAEKVEGLMGVTTESTPTAGSTVPVTQTSTTAATKLSTTEKTMTPTTNAFKTWTRSGNMVYKYFRYDNVNFLTAKDRCESYGARLASTVLRDPKVIRDLAQAGFIDSQDFDSWLWIGFNDRVTEGDWIWSDGGRINTQTTDWWPGEPNQFKNTNEDCGCIIAVEDGKILLNDAPCSFTLQYICEAEMPLGLMGVTTESTPTAGSTVPVTQTSTTAATTLSTTEKTMMPTTNAFKTWTRSGNMVYKYFRYDNVNFLTAKDRCDSYGARLASTVLRDPKVIRDLAQAGFIDSQVFGSWLWIGFNDRVTEGDWIWSDGGRMNNQTTDWWPGEPNQFKNTNEDCGCIIAVEDGRILLNDAPCSFILQYICEAEMPRDVVG